MNSSKALLSFLVVAWLGAFSGCLPAGAGSGPGGKLSAKRAADGNGGCSPGGDIETPPDQVNGDPFMTRVSHAANVVVDTHPLLDAGVDQSDCAAGDTFCNAYQGYLKGKNGAFDQNKVDALLDFHQQTRADVLAAGKADPPIPIAYSLDAKKAIDGNVPAWTTPGARSTIFVLLQGAVSLYASYIVETICHELYHHARYKGEYVRDDGKYKNGMSGVDLIEAECNRLVSASIRSRTFVKYYDDVDYGTSRPDLIVKWVKRLYRDLLHREGAPSEIDPWVSNTIVRGAVSTLDGILFSSEFASADVHQMYKDYLLRDGAATEWNSWAGLYSSLGMDEVRARILLSGEFWGNVTGTDLSQGIRDNNTHYAFLNAVFTRAYGRPPVDSEVSVLVNWTVALSNLASSSGTAEVWEPVREQFARQLVSWSSLNFYDKLMMKYLNRHVLQAEAQGFNYSGYLSAYHSVFLSYQYMSGP